MSDFLVGEKEDMQKEFNAKRTRLAQMTSKSSPLEKNKSNDSLKKRYQFYCRPECARVSTRHHWWGKHPLQQSSFGVTGPWLINAAGH